MMTFVRKYGRLVALVLFGVITSSILFILFSRLFVITTIEIIGEGVTLSLDEARLQKNILLFPSELIRRNLLRDNPLLSDLTIGKKYPHTLIITLLLRHAIARMIMGNRMVGIDKDGVILGESRAYEALPFLDMSSEIHGLNITSAQSLSALKFLSAVQSFLPVLSITSYDALAFDAYTGKTEILLPESGNMEALATTLQTVLAGFRIKSSVPALIDLRFNKPVIKL